MGRILVVNSDCLTMYISGGKFITTSLSSLTGIMVDKGNHPQMAQHVRLVNYNLPRYMSPSAPLKPFAQRLNGRSSEEFCEVPVEPFEPFEAPP